MRTLSRVSGLAALAVAALALAPGTAWAGSAAHPNPAGHRQGAVVPNTVALKTKIANVHVRSVPHSGAGSQLVGTIAAAGTTVDVVCYAVTAGKYWFQITTPSGFVAARNLDYPRPHGVKVPPGLAACPPPTL
ncbi:MAG: hypothetical protein V7603_5311 [Micromonosporaceae bacterium]|jgi:hypothetical protein